MAKEQGANFKSPVRNRSDAGRLKINYLSEKSIQIREQFAEKLRPDVPPTSPKELIFDYGFATLPADFPRLGEFKLPLVRDVGIKASIERLAEYFRCKDYKFNLIQFWFLDVLADCLWRAQDEFQFPDEHQKVILEWILYMFNLIRAQHLNLSKKKVFGLFKEAMAIAEDYIQSGCPTVPLPEELFALNSDEDETEDEGESSATLNSSGSSASTDSTISLQSGSAASSYVAVKFDDNTEYFKLPAKPCPWDTDEECMSTSIETLSELDLVKTLEKNKQVIEEAEPEELELDFYKASMSIPPRFVPSRISFGFSFSLSFDDLLDEESSSSDETKERIWVDEPRRQQKPPCPSQLTVKRDVLPGISPVHDSKSKKAGKPPGKHHEEVAAAGEDDHSEEVLRAWFSYHLWHHRMEEMADPNKGWVPFEEAIIESNKEVNALNDTFAPPEAKMEWMDYLEKRKELTKRMKENIFINNCVLLAIKQFVFDYFYETFLFTLLKIAFRCSHSLITQQVNDKWYVPKIIKTDLKMPKPKKPKKEKKPKEKKPKKEKKAKGAKDKKGKGKGKEKKEKKKKEKPKKLTKEEKAELARLKREQELLEEEERKAEENRRFMFPLGEAATDDFFKGIFENWVKVEKKSKDKKGKKKK